ncbi:MAG: SIR2 family protein [Bacteroidia bacterium]|nr:SIR2 family protein [Bacteroidia bacterium]
MANKVLYLFGAGATHAEVMNSEADPDQEFKEKYGLLITDVSKRVIKRAHDKIPWLRKHENVFASKKGSFNIELLISLFESNRIPDYVISSIKKEVRDDIKSILSQNRRKKFYLHNALLELHKAIEEKEELLGVISLNYDTILDDAFEKFGYSPNYCFSSETKDGKPLLKLHGSFNWERINIEGKTKSIPIIPLGSHKNYLFPPYNFIWGRAYELLKKCTVLRIVGCSLNQNDGGLVDLLFKAHSDKTDSIKMKIIDFQPKVGHHSIKSNFGFFPGIVDPNPSQPDLNDPEEVLIADPQISDYEKGNPFKIWLKAKAKRMLTDEEISKTKYLKKCF